MHEKPLLKELNMTEEELDSQVAEIMSQAGAEIDKVIEDSVKNFEEGTILQGKVLHVSGDEVIIDVGYKSEGTVPVEEFGSQDSVEPGALVEVLLDQVEDESGLIVLSKRKADRIRGWEKIVSEHSEGDVVRGRAMRKIKGGLLVDIGVPAFLPASQVDIRRPSDIGEFLDQEIDCKILKIDEKRNNIVVSRRRLIEERRETMKEQLLGDIEVGQMRKGVVKNIVDFGAFVDLGGIDGLLHITDMSWGRVSHPSEAVAIDQEVEVKVISVDKERERIALGLKQLSENPWQRVPEKYPVGERVRGEVVNITNYGAFVKLEEGVEGLVHVSEMSWTRHVNHPSEVVAIGDIVEVVVLGINEEKQEISLGMKQTESNPWDLVEEKYPVGVHVKGRVRNLVSYGAFVELEEGIDGLLHVSDMSWTKKVNHPSEILKKGDKIEAAVLNVSRDKKRIALGLKQLSDNPWENDIPSRYSVGDRVTGKVTQMTSFGAFVELEPGLEGLLHVSELADHKVAKPDDMLSVGEEVEVYIIRVEPQEQKIGLSLRGVVEEKPDEKPDDQSAPEAEPEEEEKAEAENADVEKAEAEEQPVAQSSDEAEESEAPEVSDDNGGQEETTASAADEPEEENAPEGAAEEQRVQQGETGSETERNISDEQEEQQS